MPRVGEAEGCVLKLRCAGKESQQLAVADIGRMKIGHPSLLGATLWTEEIIPRRPPTRAIRETVMVLRFWIKLIRMML